MTPLSKKAFLEELRLEYVNKSDAMAKRLQESDLEDLVADITYHVEIRKSNSDSRVIEGFASVSMVDGEPVIDKVGDYIEPEELERAVNHVNTELQKSMIKINHNGESIGHITQSLVINDEILSFGLNTLSPSTNLDAPIAPGCGWYLKAKITSDSAWKEIQAKEMTGFSIGAMGIRFPE